MKDRTQEIGWLILFLIASGFLGFFSARILQKEDFMAWIITGTAITAILFAISALLYHLYKRKAGFQSRWTMLMRGCYHEVDRQIDENSKEMNQLWELKLLACFHSGDRITFDRLYKEYMNEINECKTLASYMLGIIKDLMDAVYHEKPPAAFLKNESPKKHSYMKQREYQLYRNLRLGIQEYYGPQKQLMKIYFDKFMMQTEVLSKPLGFYLYYLMTSVMIDSDHPQWEEYFQKTQQYIFDPQSLREVEEGLQPRIYGIQKGTGYQNLMDRDHNRNRRNNPLFEDDADNTMNRSFNYQQPAFRREREEQGFASRRHSADIQQEFDELNASITEHNAFPLYEEDEMDLYQRNHQNDRFMQQEPATLPQDDVADDLDPTWFARKTLDDLPDTNNTASYARRNPAMSEPLPNNTMRQPSMNRNPMAQDPMMRSSAYQDETPDFTTGPRQTQMRRQEEAPAFVSQRSPSMNQTQMNQNQMRQPQMQERRMNPNMAQPNMQAQGARPMMANQNMQQPRMNQRPATPQNQSTQMKDFISAQNPMLHQGEQPIQPRQAMPQMRSDAMEQPAANMQTQNRFQRFDEPQPQATRPSMQAQTASQKPQKKHRFGHKKEEKQDPFGFDNPNALGKDPFHEPPPRQEAPVMPKQKKAVASTAEPGTFHTYVKHNIIIFFITLLDACFVAMTSSSVMYMTFFKRYAAINSDIVPDIMMMALIITICVAYLTAGTHTGYTILKKSLRNWSPVMKIVLSPVLLIVSFLIGAICEIPYLIFACIKKGNE